MQNPISTAGRDAGSLSQWEQAALTSWGRYITRAEQRMILQAAATAGSPGLVLDNGCGEGRWTQLLRRRGWQAICADTDPVALGKCRLRNPGTVCLLVSPDDGRLPAADGTVGLLLCIEVPGVLESGWFQAEARRVLKAGGLLLGIFHNRNSPRGWFRSAADAARGKPSFYRLGFSQWRRALRRAGLEIVRAEGLCWFPFHRTSNSRWIPFFARVEQMTGLRALVSSSPWVLFTARKDASPGTARESAPS